MFNRRQFLAASGALGCSIGFNGGVRAATAASVTFGPATPVYALTNIAMEKGLFREEGLDLKVVAMDAGARARQTLAAGGAMFAHGDASHPLQLSNRGKKSRMILATQVVASYANIVVRKDLYDSGITSVEAFGAYKRPNGGKPVIAATAIGSGTWMFGTHVLEARKLDKAVTWVAGGGTTTSLAGLQSKQFDAIMAPPSWQVEAERNGYGRNIYDVTAPGVWARDFGGNLPVLVIYTLEETIEREPKTVQSFVNAMMRAMAWVKATPPEEVFALVAKYYGAVDPVAAKAELNFDRNTWAYDGAITAEDFARGGKVWYRDGTDIPPTDYAAAVDMRFRDEAKKNIG